MHRRSRICRKQRRGYRECLAQLHATQLIVVQYDLLLIGGLSGRVDQTVHVMSLLHKLRKTRPHSFILSSESLAWVVDKVRTLIAIWLDIEGEKLTISG